MKSLIPEEIALPQSSKNWAMSITMKKQINNENKANYCPSPLKDCFGFLSHP